jgi:hypothetical protein
LLSVGKAPRFENAHKDWGKFWDETFPISFYHINFPGLKCCILKKDGKQMFHWCFVEAFHWGETLDGFGLRIII